MRTLTPRVLARALAAAAIIATMSVASVAAHSQTVDPNGNGAGFTKPISNPWAMAHCKAASPLHVDETSGGVVAFSPGIAFENCVPGTRGD
jgi:hypothetical protein